MSDSFTLAAAARSRKHQERIATQLDRATIRYVFAPFDEMICDPLGVNVPCGRIVPISAQGQPVGEVYLQALAQNGNFNPADYDLRNGVAEIEIAPAPLVDGLLSRYRDQGAIQIKSLYGVPVEDFTAGQFNEEIFGEGNCTFAGEYLARFAEVRAKFADDSSAFARRLMTCLAELEQSVSLAFGWATAQAEDANTQIANGDLRKFAEYHRRLFRFSGVTPRDEALNKVARDQQTALAALPAVVQTVVDQAKAAQPDWKELGRGLAEGLKETLAAAQQQPAATQPTQPSVEESKKTQGNQPSGKR